MNFMTFLSTGASKVLSSISNEILLWVRSFGANIQETNILAASAISGHSSLNLSESPITSEILVKLGSYIFLSSWILGSLFFFVVSLLIKVLFIDSVNCGAL